MTERIGRYEVVQPLGEDTFLAKATGLGGFDRLVVVRLAKKDADKERIVDAAKRVANLRHPNVLPIYDVGEHDERVFVVVDYVPGATLAALSGENLPKRLASRILIDALQGLEAVELHGSFSAKCIVVGTDGVARVTDLAIGTTADSAREADLRAAGVTAWETLTGKKWSDDADDDEVPAPFTAAVAAALSGATKSAAAFAKDLGKAAREGGLLAEPEELAEHVKAHAAIEQKKKPIETPRDLPVPPLPPKQLAVPETPISSVLALKVDLSAVVPERAETSLLAAVEAPAAPAADEPKAEEPEPEVYTSPVAGPPSPIRRAVDHVNAWPKKKKEIVGAIVAASGALLIVLLFAKCISGGSSASAANDGGVEGSAASAAMGSASDDDIETDEAASADPMALPPPPSPSASVTAAQVTKKAGTPKEKRTWPKRGVKK